MRKYLAWDKELERINEVVAFNMYGFDDENGNIIVKCEEEDDSSNWLPSTRFILMECIGRKDINENELHENAIIKYDVEFGDFEPFNEYGLVGVIKYNEKSCGYEVFENDEIFYSVSSLSNIKKIGIMPMDSELLGF